MDDMTYTATFRVRVTPEMKAELEQIAARGVSQRLSDHIRTAIRQYIDRWAAEADGESGERTGSREP